MNTWEEFDREARSVELATKEQAPECVQLVQDAVGHFADAFAILKISDKTNATKVRLSLLSQNLASLKCAVDLALRGYYNQSVNLLRIVYENWIAFHYLSNCPDKAHFWLQKDKHPPRHSVMLNKLDKNYKSLKGKMKECYHILCRFSHPDAVGVLPQISPGFTPDEIIIYFGSIYKDDLFKASAYQISQLAGHMLSAISQWVPNMNEWHNKSTMILERILAFINQENENMEFKSKTI